MRGPVQTRQFCSASVGVRGCCIKLPQSSAPVPTRITTVHAVGWQLNRGFKERKDRGVVNSCKFHCELDFIEWYWCDCKCYARENCQYTLGGLNLVSSATTHRHYLRCMRIIMPLGLEQHMILKNGCIRLTSRFLTSQSGNISPRAGVVQEELV